MFDTKQRREPRYSKPTPGLGPAVAFPAFAAVVGWGQDRNKKLWICKYLSHLNRQLTSAQNSHTCLTNRCCQLPPASC